ncbi:hypothetical protein [Streptomyces sp. NPDC004134]|uniref:hypothetical protein n=1 Tax=Streptomyces sp. NPDC004134 TaxID=3364691 RepID=UPI0036BDC30C
MSDQRHDPTPWSAAPPAPAGWAPYEEPREGAEAGTPSGHTQFPPAAGQGDDGYAGPETQLGMALHEESAAAQQTSYLPPVTDAGPYGGGYGGSAGAGGPGAPYGGGQDPAGAGQPGGIGAGYGEGSYGGGQVSPAGGQQPGPGRGQGSADAGRAGRHAAPYGGHGRQQPGGPGGSYGSGSPGGGTGPGGPPQAYAAGSDAPGTAYPAPAGSDGRGAAAPYGPGAVEETAYMPPVTDAGPAGYGGTGAGAPAEQTAYLPPVTGHEPPGGGGAQWPDGWDRGGTGAAGTGRVGHGGAPAHPGTAAGHPGTAAGAHGPAAGHPGAGHPADVHPDVPAAGGHGHPGTPGAGFPGPGGPETGTLYGAPTPRRPKPPAEVLREEGTSVLIAPGPQPAALTAVLAGLLAVTAALDVRPGLAAAVALLQGVTAAGWFRLNGMWPAREGIALAAAAGLTATGAVLAVDEDDATIAALGSLGGWFLLICLVQLRHTTAPKERLTALNVALAAATLAVLAAGYLAAERHAVVVGAVAVAAGTLGRAVPLPPNASPVAAVAAAGAGGLAAGLGTDMGADGGLLGLAAGVCVLVAVRVASYDYPSRFVHMTAGVSLPLTLSVPAVHLLGLALL